MIKYWQETRHFRYEWQAVAFQIAALIGIPVFMWYVDHPVIYVMFVIIWIFVGLMTVGILQWMNHRRTRGAYKR